MKLHVGDILEITDTNIHKYLYTEPNEGSVRFYAPISKGTIVEVVSIDSSGMWIWHPQFKGYKYTNCGFQNPGYNWFKKISK